MIYFISLSAIFLVMVFIGIFNQKVDWGHPVMNWLDGWNRFCCRWYHGLAIGKIKLPNGPLLLISNHYSGLDPFLLIAACDRPLRFLIAKEEYERPFLNKMFKLAGCIPVDRLGRVEAAFREALKNLKQGEVVALFPHGKIHLADEEFKPLKKGVFKLAALSKSDIHPFHIQGVSMQGTVVSSVFVPGRVKISPLKVYSAQEVQDPLIQHQLACELLGLPEEPQ
ncbi:MAG: 1-acyl-sn-glycerol-3-phosphate acyltransferase [Gammaproteobacteria bacterium CG22_combo_CG10-13_8_21_14_all_40_8]|nr:MAG: 1-acyl-sn-glycerol-3-phosphate acyltransferase [Gammaproteobacteria bacterium CG22_combo_CG10-13_8_21_14_all_40_8]